MAVVVAVMVAFVALTLSLVVITNALVTTRSSGVDRQRAEAVAAAEAGVDAALAGVRSSAKVGSEAAMPCSVPAMTVASFPDTNYVTTSISYRTVASAGKCPLANGEQPTSALVTAIATPRVLGGGQTTGRRTLQAELNLAAGAHSPSPAFQNAVFSDGGLPLTNTFNTVGGGIYTNGDLSCNSSADIAGDAIAQGAGYMTSTCTVRRSVSVKGTYRCDSNATVMGNVSASGTGESYLTSSCHIVGNLTTADAIRMDSHPTIGGNVTSASAGLSLQSTVTISKDVRLGTRLTMTDGQNYTSAVKGALYENQPSSPPAAPQVQTMPMVAYDPAQWPGFTVTTWADWVKANAAANNAPSWSDARNNPCNQLDGANWSLNGPLVSPSTPTIIDARGCTPLGTLSGITLRLRDDLTIFANNFTSTNGLTVVSDDGHTHKLRIIVPAKQADVCAGGGGDIEFNAGGTVLDSKVQLMLYSPGAVRLTNTVSFYGGIYACRTDLSVATTVNYVDVSPPGSGSVASGSSYTVSGLVKREVTSS